MDLSLNVKFVTISTEDREGYALFTFAGRYDYADFSAIIRGLREECVRRGATRALLDISKVEGDIPGMERYDLGLQFAEVWGGRLKAGIVAPRDRINKLFENTAVNRYAQVHVDHDETAVVQWLLED
jgi:hypothetical protein